MTEQAENAFSNSDAYQKVKNNLIFSQPISTKEITNKDGKIENEILIYKVNTNNSQDFTNKNATGTVSTTVESPLVINYDVVNKKLSSAIVFDYSTAISSSNKIKVINLLSDDSIFLSPDKLGNNFSIYANNIKNGQKQAVEDTTENVVLPKKSDSSTTHNKRIINIILMQKLLLVQYLHVQNINQGVVNGTQDARHLLGLAVLQ